MSATTAPTETVAELIDSRRRRGESLGAFAARAGLDPKTIYRLRTGAIEHPTHGALTLLAIACKVKVDRVRAAHLKTLTDRPAADRA